MNQEDDGEPLARQVRVVESLTRLAASLKDLPDHESAPLLSHYRHLPDVVTQSYDLLQQGSQLIHATSTKYTLLAKLDATEQARMTDDLLKGCQLLGTASVVLHDNQTGCASATRHHCKHAVRAIVHTVIQLVEVWILGGEQVLEKRNNEGARRTGAVWEMCNVILERKMPVGNRSAMRRDLLTYMRDCNVTSKEFQELIDEGPAAVADTEENEQYTAAELPIAEACLYLIKNSRGCVNVAMQAIEAIGLQLEDKVASPIDKAKLSWISGLFGIATDVGKGVTDLGAVMYPPLQFQLLEENAKRQTGSMQNLLDYVSSAKINIEADEESSTEAILEYTSEVNELRAKVTEALLKRRDQALASISSAEAKSG